MADLVRILGVDQLPYHRQRSATIAVTFPSSERRGQPPAPDSVFATRIDLPEACQPALWAAFVLRTNWSQFAVFAGRTKRARLANRRCP